MNTQSFQVGILTDATEDKDFDNLDSAISYCLQASDEDFEGPYGIFTGENDGSN